VLYIHTQRLLHSTDNTWNLEVVISVLFVAVQTDGENSTGTLHTPFLGAACRVGVSMWLTEVCLWREINLMRRLQILHGRASLEEIKKMRSRFRTDHTRIYTYFPIFLPPLSISLSLSRPLFGTLAKSLPASAGGHNHPMTAIIIIIIIIITIIIIIIIIIGDTCEVTLRDTVSKEASV